MVTAPWSPRDLNLTDSRNRLRDVAAPLLSRAVAAARTHHPPL